MIIFPDISLDNVHGVMIDLDNTLYDYDAIHNLVIDICANKCQQVDTNTFKHSYRKHRTRITNLHKPTGVCRSRLLAFLGLFEEYKIFNAWDMAKVYNDLYWQTFYKEMTIDKKAMKFLEHCRIKDIPVCVVTDMEMGVQVEKLRALGCHDYIDFMVSSEETGQEKPAMVMFKNALEKLQSKNININVDNCIMIGDSQSKDIDGAYQYGIKGHKVEII